MSPLHHCLCQRRRDPGQRSPVLEGRIPVNRDGGAGQEAKSCSAGGGQPHCRIVESQGVWVSQGKSQCPARELTSLPF